MTRALARPCVRRKAAGVSWSNGSANSADIRTLGDSTPKRRGRVDQSRWRCRGLRYQQDQSPPDRRSCVARAMNAHSSKPPHLEIRSERGMSSKLSGSGLPSLLAAVQQPAR